MTTSGKAGFRFGAKGSPRLPTWGGPRTEESPRTATIARSWGRAAIVVSSTVCLVLGCTGAAPSPSGPGPGQSTAAASPSTRATEVGSATLVAPLSTAPGESPTAPRTSIPSQTSPTATIAFNDLVLDSTLDTSAAARTFSFVSDGPGSVSVQVVSAPTTGSAKLCLTVDSGAPSCLSGAAPGFPSEITTTDHSRWTATLISAGEGSPTVDVTFSWPTKSAAITLTNGRFQGTPNPDSLRSLTATFKARSAGSFSLEAAWPPAIVNSTLTLTDQETSGPAPVDEVHYPGKGSIDPAYSHSVVAGKVYRVQLMNDSADGRRPNLSATIAFP